MGQRANRRTVPSQSPLGRPVAVLPRIGIAVVIVYALAMGSTHWRAMAERSGLDSRWATVATDVLNIRSGPATDTAIVGALTEGSRVEVVGPAERGFAPVRIGVDQAWVAVSWLTFDDGRSEPGESPPVVADIPAEVMSQVEPDLVAEEAATGPADVVAESPVQPAERWIDIDRTTATVTLYEGEAVIASFAGRIGRDPSADGFYATAIGTYHVFSMNKGLAPTPFADDTYLTDWVGFDPVRKNGIHSPVRDAHGAVKPWQNPSTLGCVRLEAEDAETVFAFARIGMRVEVHD